MKNLKNLFKLLFSLLLLLFFLCPNIGFTNDILSEKKNSDSKPGTISEKESKVTSKKPEQDKEKINLNETFVVKLLLMFILLLIFINQILVHNKIKNNFKWLKKINDKLHFAKEKNNENLNEIQKANVLINLLKNQIKELKNNVPLNQNEQIDREYQEVEFIPNADIIEKPTFEEWIFSHWQIDFDKLLDEIKSLIKKDFNDCNIILIKGTEHKWQIIQVNCNEGSFIIPRFGTQYIKEDFDKYFESIISEDEEKNILSIGKLEKIGKIKDNKIEKGTIRLV